MTLRFIVSLVVTSLKLNGFDANKLDERNKIFIQSKSDQSLRIRVLKFRRKNRSVKDNKIVNC